MGKNPDPESGMNIPDPFSESLETVFELKMRYLNSLMLIWDPESFLPWIRDGKNSDPGSWINIPDPQHCYIDRQTSNYKGTVPESGTSYCPN
jgi:hypothetical protein